MKVWGEAQVAASHIFFTEIPFNWAHDVATPLVEWAHTLGGGSLPHSQKPWRLPPQSVRKMLFTLQNTASHSSGRPAFSHHKCAMPWPGIKRQVEEGRELGHTAMLPRHFGYKQCIERNVALASVRVNCIQDGWTKSAWSSPTHLADTRASNRRFVQEHVQLFSLQNACKSDRSQEGTIALVERLKCCTPFKKQHAKGWALAVTLSNPMWKAKRAAR